MWGFSQNLELLKSYFPQQQFSHISALSVPPGHFTSPSISRSVRFHSPGKDARLFVFRLSAVQRAIEGKQAARGRCDCRGNKLEKTKGDLLPWVLLVPVQALFLSDCPDFTKNKK